MQKRAGDMIVVITGAASGIVRATAYGLLNAARSWLFADGRRDVGRHRHCSTGHFAGILSNHRERIATRK